MTPSRGIHGRQAALAPAATGRAVPPTLRLAGGGDVPRPAGTGHPRLVAAEDERTARIGEARRAEREARTRLQGLLAAGDRSLREASRRLAGFDAALEAIRAVLRRSGYLG